MRVHPNWLIAVVLAIVYAAIVSVLWWVMGVDYNTVGDSTENVLNGVVIPIGAGAVFLLIAGWWLGWWGPALVERTGYGEGWMLLAPAVFVVAAIGNFMSGEVGSQEISYLLVLAAGVLLVGFSEESLTRGLGLVGLRGSMPELGAWFVSCLIFGLIHAINALFGQDLGTTLFQIGFAFMAGTLLYVTRVASGLLVVAMLAHALWDFSTLSHGPKVTEGLEGTAQIGYLLSLVQLLAYLIAFVALVRIMIKARRSSRTQAE